VNDLYLFLAVPIVTALVGWGTNWAAVKMIFHPAEFKGIGPIGWQGIIYRSAPILAAGVGDMLSKQLMSSKEMAEKLDTKDIQDFVDTQFEAEGEPLLRSCAEAVLPGAWEKLDESARQSLTLAVRKEVVTLVGDVAEAVNGTLEEVLDVKAIVVHALSGENAGVLAAQMQRVAAKELKFIEIYGGVFGFGIGIIEMGAWSVFQVWWVMPIVGVIVGLVTNYLAILMIFKPQEPTRYLGLVTYQGLFPKRQQHIAEEYGHSTANEVLTPKNLIELMSQGENRVRLQATIWSVIADRMGALRERITAILPVPLDDKLQEKVKGTLQSHGESRLPALRKAFEEFLHSRLGIARTVESKLGDLSKSEFEGLLRPLFEQDEPILIAVGGVLGGIVGTLQGLAVLALT